MSTPGLKRAVGLGLITAQGVGIIVGAGIYVLVGSVAQAAGDATPLAFLLAGVLAALIGFCYAELAGRFPEAAGAPAYVQEAFGIDLLSRATGLAVALVLAFSVASIARGFAAYLQVFLALPTPVLAGAAVLLGIAIACLGVRESLAVAAAMTAIELGGLALVVVAGAPAAAEAIERLPSAFAPIGMAGWAGVLSGSFLAFFAFIGFENLANMAEETRDTQRTLPRAILLSLGISTAVYAVVATVTVLAVPREALVTAQTPLLLVVRGATWLSADLFAVLALIAVANGVLLELVALARLLYGMARRGWLPTWLSSVHPGSQVPRRATWLGGGLTLLLTVSLPFVSLVELTSLATLLVFALVAAALWRLQRVAPRRDGFRVNAVVPPLAFAASLGLIAASFLTKA